MAPNEDVAVIVIHALRTLEDESSLRLLVEKGLSDPRPRVRRTAVQTLSFRRAFADWIVESVARLVHDEDKEVRRQILLFCGTWNRPEAVPLARALLKDSDSNVRGGSASTLGDLLSQDAVPDLIEALADPDSSVRETAKKALDRIRFYHEEKKRWDDWYRGRGADPGEGVRRLLASLDDPSAEIRLAAIESLGTMKAKEALPRLVELLKAGAPPEQEAAARAISKINRED